MEDGAGKRRSRQEKISGEGSDKNTSNTKEGKQSFASRIQDEWNNLSDGIKKARNPKAFRSSYKKATNLV